MLYAIIALPHSGFQFMASVKINILIYICYINFNIQDKFSKSPSRRNISVNGIPNLTENWMLLFG
jgi:hypothetical protein